MMAAQDYHVGALQVQRQDGILDRAADRMEAHAVRGQAMTAPVSLHKLHADRLFELLQLFGQSRLSQIEAARGACHARRIAESAEIPKLAEGHVWPVAHALIVAA